MTIEGPRFSSKAESMLYKSWGCDLVNMTIVPEVILAKEIGLCYAAIAMSTDYDCWRDSGNKVCVNEVMATFKNNVKKVIELLTATVANIAKEDWTETIQTAKVYIFYLEFLHCNFQLFFFFVLEYGQGSYYASVQFKRKLIEILKYLFLKKWHLLAFN